MFFILIFFLFVCSRESCKIGNFCHYKLLRRVIVSRRRSNLLIFFLSLRAKRSNLDNFFCHSSGSWNPRGVRGKFHSPAGYLLPAFAGSRYDILRCRCERSEAISLFAWDCFVAALLAMTTLRSGLRRDRYAHRNDEKNAILQGSFCSHQLPAIYYLFSIK